MIVNPDFSVQQWGLCNRACRYLHRIEEVFAREHRPLQQSIVGEPHDTARYKIPPHSLSDTLIDRFRSAPGRYYDGCAACEGSVMRCLHTRSHDGLECNTIANAGAACLGTMLQTLKRDEPDFNPEYRREFRSHLMLQTLRRDGLNFNGGNARDNAARNGFVLQTIGREGLEIQE